MITLEQIEEDIKSGKSTVVFFSARTLWWTHLESDLEQATEKGRIAQQKKHDDFMKSDIEDQAKERFKSLFNQVKESKIPLDPTGSPTYQSDASHWIKKARNDPEHFGENKLNAFLFAHHQNCGDYFFSNWDHYNNIIITEKLFPC